MRQHSGKPADRARLDAEAFPSRAVSAHPGGFSALKIVFGHAGLRRFDEFMAYAREFPQAYLELSGQPVGVGERIFRQCDPDRILYGSDWTFYPLAVPLARTLIALQRFPRLRDKVLWRNAAQLWDIDAAMLDFVVARNSPTVRRAQPVEG